MLKATVPVYSTRGITYSRSVLTENLFHVYVLCVHSEFVLSRN